MAVYGLILAVLGLTVLQPAWQFVPIRLRAPQNKQLDLTQLEKVFVENIADQPIALAELVPVVPGFPRLRNYTRLPIWTRKSTGWRLETGFPLKPEI